MNLEFVSSMIRRSRYENEVSQVQGIKLPVTLNLELNYPTHVQEGSRFLIVIRVSVGNPVQKFAIYLEQVCSFRITDLEPGFDTSRDNMQKFISAICHPISLREAQHAMDGLTALYKLAPIKLPTNTGGNTRHDNVVDLSGRGLPS